MNKAKELLFQANKNKANTYAIRHYEEAVNIYDSAMILWKAENEKLIFFRDYTLVEAYANRAAEIASSSISKANTGKNTIKKNLEAIIDSLEEELRKYSTYYHRIPMEESMRKSFTKAQLIFKEAVIAYKNKDYTTALKKIEPSREIIIETNAWLSGKIKSYFASYPDWEKMKKTALEASRKQKSTCIIIDKYNRYCYLFRNGKQIKAFPVELGPNWMGHKLFQGDKATPEGRYKVTSKKQKQQTIYYKALLLDYPNEDDKKKFTVNKKKGIVHKNAGIGKYIEIHGHGGKGADWTDGCVALKNDDMDALYQQCNIGTPVYILGSTKSYNEIFHD